MDVETIAKGLSEVQRSMVIALCGNAWSGGRNMSPGIAVLNGLGLMHIDALKDSGGSLVRYQAKPTPLGRQVRAALQENE